MSTPAVPATWLHLHRHHRRRDFALRHLLMLTLLLQLAVIAAGLWPAVAVWQYYAPGMRGPWGLTLLLLGVFLVFNIAYVVALLAVRLVIPRPRPGFTPWPAGAPMPRQVFIFLLNRGLTRMRYETPWSAIVTAVLTRVGLLAPLSRRWLGPHGRSMTLGDVMQPVDPWAIRVGHNVQFGGTSALHAAVLDGAGLTVAPITIEDGALVGGASLILPGAHIEAGAVVGSRSVLSAFTRVPAHEFWAGAPARFIKRLDEPSPADDAAT